MRIKNYLLLFLFILSGCLNNTLKGDLDEFLNPYGYTTENIKYIVFLNLDACDSCDTTIETFLSENPLANEALIVISSFSKKKAQYLVNKAEFSGRFLIDQKREAITKYFFLKDTPRVLHRNHTNTFESRSVQLSELLELSHEDFF